MPAKSLMFESSDGTTYVFDVNKRRRYKMVQISMDEIPSDVRKKAFEYLEDAADVQDTARVLKELL